MRQRRRRCPFTCEVTDVYLEVWNSNVQIWLERLSSAPDRSASCLSWKSLNASFVEGRTVTTVSAVAQSLSQRLSQQNGISGHTNTHISPALSGSLLARPNQLTRDENVWVPGRWGLLEHWLSKRHSSDRLIQLHKTHTHTSHCVSEALHCFQGFIEYSVFIPPRCTQSLLNAEKCKSASGRSQDIGPLFHK